MSRTRKKKSAPPPAPAGWWERVKEGARSALDWAKRKAQGLWEYFSGPKFRQRLLLAVGAFLALLCANAVQAWAQGLARSLGAGAEATALVGLVAHQVVYGGFSETLDPCDLADLAAINRQDGNLLRTAKQACA